jgi:hypothetical protein
MANPFHHAVSSTRKWGGEIEDYLPIHAWFDASKEMHGDFRHRALRHHTQGIFECERAFGVTITLTKPLYVAPDENLPPEAQKQVAEAVFRSEYGVAHTCTSWDVDKRHWIVYGPVGRQIPVRWIGEQHVLEDLGRIPSLSDWLRCIKPESWMNRSRKLSAELEVSQHELDEYE